jgi:DNA-binding MarR family transcriptional regulator
MTRSKRGASEEWPLNTVSRPQLLKGGRDDDFRRLVDDMVRFGAALQRIRENLAQNMGVSPPQYSLLMKLARSNAPALTATHLASALNVTVAFVVTESSKLAAQDLIQRQRNPRDGRSVLISLTDKGRQKLIDAAPLICRVNDELFAPLTRPGMEQLARTTAALLRSSKTALELCSPAAEQSRS